MLHSQDHQALCGLAPAHFPSFAWYCAALSGLILIIQVFCYLLELECYLLPTPLPNTNISLFLLTVLAVSSVVFLLREDFRDWSQISLLPALTAPYTSLL